MKSTSQNISFIDNRLADKAVIVARSILETMEHFDISHDKQLKTLKTMCEDIQMLYAERCLSLVRKSDNYQAGTFVKG